MPCANSSDCNNSHLDPFPTSISDLHIPSSSHNFSITLSSLKRSTLSPHNRLQSIQHDSHFVESIASEHGVPLIANERCGSWYIPPEKKAGVAYFKSTDGHFGEWSFSMRRLNLQILEIIGSAGGCVIVDSTRRGKSMPDALSKTIPIWCVILNRLLFPERPRMHGLHTPKKSVGASEHAQMNTRIDQFVRDARSLELDIVGLRALVKKPLIPSWITPDVKCMTDTESLGDHNHIICCTASRRVDGTEGSENGYIQGAADDHEGWSHGLTPTLFWKHEKVLLEMSEDAIPAFVQQHTEAADEHKKSSAIEVATTGISLGILRDVEAIIPCHDAAILLCSEPPPPTPADTNKAPDKPYMTLHIPCKPNKLGSRALRIHLPHIIAFLAPFYSSTTTANTHPRILIACTTSTDLSVGVALAVLCTFYDDDGCIALKEGPKPPSSSTPIDKTVIRRRLAAITASKPDVNPSRATLQSVHAFLMP